MHRKFFASVVFAAAAAMAMPIHDALADCDKSQARQVLALIEANFARREFDDSGAVTWYHWRQDWSRLSRSQKYDLVDRIGGLEQCLSGKAVRIRYQNRDVARSSLLGKVEIFE